MILSLAVYALITQVPSTVSELYRAGMITFLMSEANIYIGGWLMTPLVVHHFLLYLMFWRLEL